jgi:hypothetical protein
VPWPNSRDSPINFVVVLIFVPFFAYYVDTLLASDFLLFILDFRLNPALNCLKLQDQNSCSALTEFLCYCRYMNLNCLKLLQNQNSGSAQQSFCARDPTLNCLKLLQDQNSCSAPTEFLCQSSNYCISRALVCNHVRNCGADDNSDEENCKFFTFM